MEKTLIILKPDCLTNKNAGKVISRFENEGFSIIASKMIRLSSEVLREHYSHVADKPFYPEIEAFMSSCPVICLVLKGNNVVARVRELLGPTNSKEAPEGTIRGDLGTDQMRNVVHASDSVENGKIEIDRFFRNDEVYG
jgi:nucleoside-diphosphate kinase